MRHSTTLPHEYYGDAEFPEVLRGLVDAAPPLPRDWSPKERRPAQDIELPLVEEDMSDDVDAALEAETKNELAPIGDQLLAHRLIGRLVQIAGTDIAGTFESWRRDAGIIVAKLELDTGAYTEARLDDLILVDAPAPLRAGVDLGREGDDSVVVVGAGQARIDDSTLTAEHGPGVSISVSTPEGEHLGSWRTFEDGTHVVDDPKVIKDLAFEEISLTTGESVNPHMGIVETVEQVPACRICGCTDDRACAGGCYWVEEDLCSNPACIRVGRGFIPDDLEDAAVTEDPEVTATSDGLVHGDGSFEPYEQEVAWPPELVNDSDPKAISAWVATHPETAPDWAKGTPPPPGINPVPEVDPAEVAEQKEKGISKLLDEAGFKKWKKSELPWLLEQVDAGYGPGARPFRELNEVQLEEVRRARPHW